MRKIISGFLAISAALALAGCGGGGGGGSSGPGSTSNAGGSASAAPTLAAATSVIDGTTLGTEYWPTGSTSTGGQGQTVNGFDCGQAGKNYTYTHLSIYMNGKQLAIPANIGVVQPTLAAPKGCMYPLNTVDETGKIRMLQPSNAPYTLGQFFAIWGQPLPSDNSNVAGLQGSPINVYVNDGGKLTHYTGCLCALALPVHGEITIMIGTPLAQIPTYTWTDPPPFASTPITLTYGGTVGTTPYWPDGDTSTGGAGANIDGMACTPSPASNYHVHAHLAIIYNGQWLQLPEHIGLPSQCSYEMHTHDHTGIIHIEAPNVNKYTLGKFFDVWGQPLTSTNVAGLAGDVVAYINDNGEARRYMGDLRSIELISQRDVTLQVGTPAIGTLATYSWYEPQ